MPPKKGVSLDDKRQRILDIFHESADVFVLKDIEKLASKRGVVLQTVKEVLQALVDDDLVHQEKIGISNYFWSFPSEASVQLDNEMRKKSAELAKLTAREAEVAASLVVAKAGKEESEERAALMARLRQLQAQAQQQAAELGAYRASDPEAVEAMRQGRVAARDAANRWLDNTYNLLSWCKRQFPGRESELASFFQENGLTDTIGYME